MARSLGDWNDTRAVRIVLASVVTNFTMGLLYAWSLFASAFVESLQISSAATSGVAAVSLGAFTIGVTTLPSMRVYVSRSRLVVVAFAGAGAGIGAVAIIPSVWTLLAGFGLLFGVAAGVGYGLAFEVVNQLPSSVRSPAIGFCMTSFALTAIVASPVVDPLLIGYGIRGFFSVLATAVFIAGAIVLWLLWPLDDVGRSRVETLGHGSDEGLRLGGTRFAFFALCCSGLALLPVTGLLLETAGVSTFASANGAAVFNLGYLFFALSGAKVAEKFGGKFVILACLFGQLAVLTTAILDFRPWVGWSLLGVCGAVLGGTASVFPMYLTEIGGAKAAGRHFPRLLVYYGLAGFSAPFAFTVLREWCGNYEPSLLALAFITVLAILRFLRAPSGNRSNLARSE